MLHLQDVWKTPIWTLHFCQLGGGVRNPDLTSCGDFTGHALSVGMWRGSWDSSTSGSCFDHPRHFTPSGRSMYISGTHLRNSPKITLTGLNVFISVTRTQCLKRASDVLFACNHNKVPIMGLLRQLPGFDVVYACQHLSQVTLPSGHRDVGGHLEFLLIKKGTRNFIQFVFH